MGITVPKIVKKPWGNELWIADGERTPYALKKIVFNQGFRSSLQVHKYKFETNYVLEGTGIIQIREERFDVDAFLGSDNQIEIIESATRELVDVQISPGDVLDVKPGQIHRVIAYTKLVFIEASTCELDDVIRLSDDSGRGHGKISDEHKG